MRCKSECASLESGRSEQNERATEEACKSQKEREEPIRGKKREDKRRGSRTRRGDNRSTYNFIYHNSNHLTTPALNPNNSNKNDYVDSIQFCIRILLILFKFDSVVCPDPLHFIDLFFHRNINRKHV